MKRVRLDQWPCWQLGSDRVRRSESVAAIAEKALARVPRVRNEVRRISVMGAERFLVKEQSN